MPRYRVIETAESWTVKCPATGTVRIPRDGRWEFDGDYVRPTFTPSVNIAWGSPGQTHEEFGKRPAAGRNHVYVHQGRMEYLSDCTHGRAGTTVEIPALSYAEMRMHYPEVETEPDAAVEREG